MATLAEQPQSSSSCIQPIIIVGVSTILNFFSCTFAFTFGTFIPFITRNDSAVYTEYYAVAGGVNSVLVATWYLSGVFGGVLLHHYSARMVAVCSCLCIAASCTISAFMTRVEPLFLTFSLITGSASGFLYVASMTEVFFYFTNHRMTVTAIVSAGGPIGMAVATYINEYLLRVYQWKVTLLSNGAFMLFGVVLSLALKPHAEETKNDKVMDEMNEANAYGTDLSYVKMEQNCNNKLMSEIDDHNAHGCDLEKEQDCNKGGQREPMFDFSLFRNPRCCLHIMGCVLMDLAYVFSMPLLMTHAETLGIPTYHSSLFFTIFYTVSIPGRVILGWFSESNSAIRVYLLVAYFAIGALAFFLIPVLTTFPLMILFCCLFAISYGGFMTMYSVVLADIRGVEHIQKDFGLLLTTIGPFVLVATPASGAIIDATGNTCIPFIAAGALLTVGLFCYIAMPFVGRNKDNSSTNNLLSGGNMHGCCPEEHVETLALSRGASTTYVTQNLQI